MPVAAITLPPPQHDRRGAETNLDTPAELPPGRVSFEDELGRETALRARPANDEVDAESPASAIHAEPQVESGHEATGESTSDDPGAEPDATALAMAASTTIAVAAPDDPLLELVSGDAAALLELDATLDAAGPDADLAALLNEAGAPEMPDSVDAPEAPSLEPADATTPDLVEAADFVDLAELDDPAALAGEPAVRDAVADAVDPEAALPAPPVEGVDSRALHVAATLERTASHEPTPAPAAAEGAAPSEDPIERVERLVALRDLPRALAADVDGFLRMRGRGRHWDAELRLDPPELGALHVRLELRGETLHAVVRAEDPRLETQLDGLLKDLEQQLHKQGNDASFDLRRGAREDGEGPRPSRADRSWIRGDERAVRLGGAGRSSDRLVDLFA